MRAAPRTSDQSQRPFEFCLVSVDGTKNRFHGTSAAAFFLNAPFIKFFSLAVILTALLRGPAQTNGLFGWANITLWLYLSLALLAWFLCAAMAIRWALTRGFITKIYTPIVTLLGVVITETTYGVMFTFVFEVPGLSVAEMPLYMGREFVVILIFDALFGSYVAPTHPMHERNSRHGEKTEALQQIAPPPAAKAKASASLDTALDQPKLIGIGDHSVAHDEIMVVRVEDHSLKVRLRDESIKVRGRFNDLVQELDPGLGLTINRSAWVASNAVSHAVRSRDYKLTLFLDDGTEFVVARSRWAAALEKLELWSIPIRVAD